MQVLLLFTVLAFDAGSGFNFNTGGESSFSMPYQPVVYTASYGPYHAEIPVNDPLFREDFDTTKCGQNCWGTSGYDHYKNARDEAERIYEAQREAFWG